MKNENLASAAYRLPEDGQEMNVEQENEQCLIHNNICGELHELYRKKTTTTAILSTRAMRNSA